MARKQKSKLCLKLFTGELSLAGVHPSGAAMIV